MRYLKRFNESVDLESQLRDFSESYLAYLLDDGYRIQVKPTNLKTQFMIKLYKIDEINEEEYESDEFTWLDVKDSYIPFLHMLNREYDIIDDVIEFYDGGDDLVEVDVEKVLSGDVLPHGRDNESILEILVWVTFDKSIKESVELKTDDVEHYLAYLIDDGFEVKSITEGGKFKDVKPQQSINMERKLTREELSSIYNCGLTHKVVILGIGNNPLKFFDTPHNRKESRFMTSVLPNCGLLTQVDERAHEAADRLLLDFTRFSTSKIIISFKVGEGQYQQYDFGNLSIRLQIILIE